MVPVHRGHFVGVDHADDDEWIDVVMNENVHDYGYDHVHQHRGVRCVDCVERYDGYVERCDGYVVKYDGYEVKYVGYGAMYDGCVVRCGDCAGRYDDLDVDCDCVHAQIVFVACVGGDAVVVVAVFANRLH